MGATTLSSRERVELAVSHREPDRVPLDLGGSQVTGMQASTVYGLRQALGLDSPGTPVKVIDPGQMLGEIKLDLVEALGVDVVPLAGTTTKYGYRNEGWKPWTTFDGTPVLVPGGFNTDPEPNGDMLMYPEGDKSAPPSGLMPNGGWYFDAIIRQPPIDDENLNVEDNLEEFGPISDDDLDHLRTESERLHAETDKAILLVVGSVTPSTNAPAVMLKHPKGIRDITEWYISTSTRRDFLYKVFERQCEIGIANLERVHEAVGDRAFAVLISTADFGMQTGPLVSPDTFRTLYKPFHKQVNDWIHQHTNWKVFIHSCGSVRAF